MLPRETEEGGARDSIEVKPAEPQDKTVERDGEAEKESRSKRGSRRRRKEGIEDGNEG